MRRFTANFRPIFLRGRWDRTRWPPLAVIGLLIAIHAGARAAAFQSNPPQPQAAQLFAHAAQLIQSKDYQGAAEVYEQILKIEPDSFEALNNLGVIDAHLGKYPQAASAYERALRIEPQSFPLWVNLGIAYFKDREFRNAIEPFSRAVALQPNSFQAQTLLAMSFYWTGNFTSACAQLEKLVAAKRGNPALVYLLAESYLETRQNQRLLDFIENAPEGSFQPVTAGLLEGEANDGLNRTDQAIVDFTRAAGLEPNRAGVHFGLGFLYWKNHDGQRAEAEFRREMEAGGLVAQSEAYRGDIALAHGRERQARALLEQALRLSPKTALAYYDLGVLDARAKRYHNATAELKDALRLDPARRRAYIELARVYRAQGESHLASAELQAAASVRARHTPKLFELIPAAPPA